MVDRIKNDNAIINDVKGVIASFVITLILIIVLSFLLAKTSISEEIINPAIYVITGISTFVGAFLFVKSRGVIHGAIIGGIYFFILYVLSSILNGEFGITIEALLLIITCIITSVFGGCIKTNIKK